MQRGIGEHDAYSVRIGGDVFGQAGIFGRAKHNGGGRRREKLFRFGIDMGDFFCAFKVFDHEGESFMRSVFSFSEFFNGAAVKGVASELETAQTFYGYDFSLIEIRNCLEKRLFVFSKNILLLRKIGRILACIFFSVTQP